MKLACATVRRWLAAAIDGEETPLLKGALEQHLRECPACRALADDQRSLSTTVAARWPRSPLPAALLRRVQSVTARPRPRWRPIGAAAISVCSLAALCGAVVQRALSTEKPQTLAQIAVLHHVGVASGRTPLDILSREPSGLVRWFAGRLPFELLLPRLDSPELSLVGSRLVDVAGKLAAFVVYRKGDAAIGLAVAQQQDVPPPSSATSETFRSIRFHFETIDGYEVISWSDRGLSYALVSRLPSRGGASCQVCHATGSGLTDVQEFHR